VSSSLLERESIVYDLYGRKIESHGKNNAIWANCQNQGQKFRDECNTVSHIY